MSDDYQESVVTPNKDGKNFLCFLPKVEKAKMPVTHQNTSSMITETEKRVKLKTPDELLEVLKNQCFTRASAYLVDSFMKQEGWWSYEFCYQKQLRQLDDKVVQEFVLGVYDEEATAAFNQNFSDISALKDPRSKRCPTKVSCSSIYEWNHMDLTNQPRETEVRFVCSEPRAIISSITELSTCKLFQEEKPVWHTINCNALPKDYKDTKVYDTHITMIMDSEDQTSYG